VHTIPAVSGTYTRIYHPLLYVPHWTSLFLTRHPHHPSISGGQFAFTASCISTVRVSILENPCFTRASGLTQQLPILDGLVPTLHARNNRQLSKSNHLHSLPPPSNSSSSFVLSTDSSDDDNHAYIHPKTTMSTLATVEPTSGKAPVLTTGDLTPAVVMDFENAAQDFFVAKSVPPEKQVSLILPGIKDIHIH